MKVPEVKNWVLNSPFWEAIKAICRITWKDYTLEEIWGKIVISNLVKCSASKSNDRTSPEMKKNCIEPMRFFENEVILAKPTQLVIFSGSDKPKYYDQYLSNLSYGYNQKPVFEIDRDFCKYDVAWWHQKFIEMD